MKIIMRRGFAFLFEKREIGYAKGGTFLMKEFHQKTVLKMQILHADILREVGRYAIIHMLNV